MSGRLMSDAEIRRRKKVQGAVSRTTSTLGLTGLGLTGAAALAAKKPGVLNAVKKLPRMANTTPEKMKNAAITTGLVSGGIGGVGGFNFAAYTGAVSRKRKPAMPVTKSMGVEAPVVGEVGFAKDWNPNASKFDAERSRMKRSKAYEVAGTAAAGGLATGAAHQGVKAGLLLRTNRKIKPQAKNLKSVRTAMEARRAQAGAHGRTGLALGGAAAASAATALALRNRNQSKSWAPYSKRDSVSAFGVDHEG